MYLSRIKLNTSKRKTMQALVSPNLFHGAIESAESEGRTRKLWRTDTLNGFTYLLILSEKEIDFSSVSEQFGSGETVETKCYDSLLERITDGSRWHFRLRANPTVYKFDEKSGRGKPVAHITPKHQEEWLEKQAEKFGFKPESGSCLIAESRWYVFGKGSSNNKVKILAVTYEGIMTVTSAELFKKALTCGIGREKAYGMGFITVVRCDNG